MKILIIDDETLIRQGIKKRIIKYGYKVDDIYEAKDGVEAQHYLNEKLIDVAFVDINMPYLNGLDLIKKFRSKNTHFIIVSGYDKFEYAKKAIELNVEAYLLKPIDKIEFQKVMDLMVSKIEDSRPKINDNNTQRIINVIYDNYENVNFCLQDCAALTGLSEGYITKLIKKYNNLTFVDTLNECRINKAKALLAKTEGTIKMKELANYCGFHTPQYFSTVFKKYMDMTPSEYLMMKK